MTAKEYLNQNLPFYHITPPSNLEAILMDGLQARRCDAICVIRSDNPEIWREIIHGQLTSFCQEYVIIKLLPQKHEIHYEELALDSSEGCYTGPLQNYIAKQNIKIDETDIVDRNFPRGRRPDYKDIVGEIVCIDDYGHTPIPDISILSQL